VQRELNDDGVSVGTNRVARLMRQDGLRGRAPRGWRPTTTDSAHAHPIAPNLLDRQFDVTSVELDQVW
jgi:transposase InsO family protein